MEQCVHYVYNLVFPLTECITLTALALMLNFTGDDKCFQESFFGGKKEGKMSLIFVIWKNFKLHCNRIIGILTVMRGSFVLAIRSLLKLSISYFPAVALTWLQPISLLGFVVKHEPFPDLLSSHAAKDAICNLIYYCCCCEMMEKYSALCLEAGRVIG